MAAATRTRSSSGPILSGSNAFRRAISPSGRLCSSAGRSSSGSAFASSSASSFSSRPSTFFRNQHHRSASPTRVNIVGSGQSAPSVRFSIDRPTSPGRSQVVKRPVASPAVHRKTCSCSPTTHPGSYRCSLHKGFQIHHHHHAVSSPSNRLNARRSAMTNSLVRIGTVEGDLVKRALAALIRPSSHQQRRREGFQPRPSRLSIMSKAEDL